jgi:hypothetical protein
MKANIKETHVYTLTIGKTSEENHNFTYTRRINVWIGGQDSSSVAIKTDAAMNSYVVTVMDGKNKSIIQTTINLIHADTKISVLKFIVLTTMEMEISDKCLHSGLSCFLDQELWTFLQITICHIWETWHKTRISWEGWSKHRFQGPLQRYHLTHSSTDHLLQLRSTGSSKQILKQYLQVKTT